MMKNYSISIRSFFQHRGFPTESPRIAEKMKPPKEDQTSWKRLAEQIKQEKKSGEPQSEYLDRIRGSYDVNDHVLKIEEEVIQEIASSLGRTGDKCNYKFYVMEAQGRMCDDVNAQARRNPGDPAIQAALEATVSEFNRMRKEAEEARKDLIIHRQAVGFQTSNHAAVYEKWPLPARRASDGTEIDETGLEEQARLKQSWQEWQGRQG
jgi:hypothetical protein